MTAPAPVAMERFGTYALLEKLGQGGMAEVFRAARIGSAGFSKQLAIKRVLPTLSSDPQAAMMLVDEARIAASLNHPNVLQVLDLGRYAGTYFIAMEFVAGQSLNALIVAALRRKEALGVDVACNVVQRALMGLAHAHEKQTATGASMNIIHRDISPQNIMVAYDGTVRLADFGIAKAVGRSTHTATGVVRGKLRYLAPEQLREGTPDQRLDVYAMGVVLHEMLCMRPMRRGRNEIELIQEVTTGVVPTFESCGVTLPHSVAEVAYRALAPDPDARFPSSRAFLEALDAAIAAENLMLGSTQLSQVMQRYFPDEIAHEREAEATYTRLMEQLADSDDAGADAILAEERRRSIVAMPAVTDIPAPLPTPARPFVNPVPSTTRPVAGTGMGMRVGAALLLLGVIAVGGAVWKRMDDAARMPGSLTLYVTPDDALAHVLGREVRGPFPRVVKDVPPGPVLVEVDREGHRSARQSVQVDPGAHAELRVELPVVERAVKITSVPAGAQVKLGDRVLGVTPLQVSIPVLAQGPVRLELDGHEPAEKPLDDVVHAELSPIAQPVVHQPVKRAGDTQGALSLFSEPWARVFIDGKDTGRFTPVTGLKVPAGKRQVRLVNEDMGLQMRFSVEVDPGETKTISKQLR